MKAADFSTLCTTLKRTWTRRDGVIMIMRNGPKGEHELILCVGGSRNPDFTATKCVVWNGDTLVYEGLITGQTLKDLLSDTNVCYGELTNAKLMEHNKKGKLCCLKASAASCSKECPLKDMEDVPTPPTTKS